MAKNDSSAPSSAKAGKRRWYQNLKDSYTVVQRSYKWTPIALIAMPIISIGGGIFFAITGSSKILPIFTGMLLAITLDMAFLTTLLRPAMYKQVEGKIGSAYAVISQIKRGWVFSEEPIAVNRHQDLVWQLVGRPGVVLVSEGPSSRVRSLLNNEQKRIRRTVQNVPVTFIEVGRGEGQVPLTKLNSKLRRLKKVLTKQEVPAVANRLNAIRNRTAPVPKGVDPYNTRAHRKAQWN